MTSYSKSHQKLFKAALATTVATGALVAVVPTTVNAATATFTDVKAGAHYYAPVLDLSARGIINGFPDGTFKPNQSVTRGQAAKILALTLKLDTKNVKNPGFTDVKTSDQYYGPIAALVEAGIVNGYDNKTFKPGNKLTRAQMAKIINIGFDLKVETLTDTRFTDVKKSDAYAGYVQALLTNEITTGTTATTFAPNAQVTRGQMASFIVRSEAASSVKSKVVNITDNSLELTTGTYKLSADLKKVFNATNLAALKGASVEFTLVDNEIAKVTSIGINASGTATENVVLDGQGSTFAGTVAVNGDYVTLKDLTIKGNLEIGSNVKNHFNADKITVEGKTLISDKITTGALLKTTSNVLTNAVAFDVPVTKGFAKVVAKTEIVFLNSTLNAVEVTNKTVTIDVKGTSKVKEFVLSANVLLKADAGVTIPKVTIKDGATEVTIDATVQSLVVNSVSKLVLDGSGNIKEATVEGKGNVTFNSTGKIDKLDIKSKDAKIALGANAKVGDLVLPAGVNAKDIIQDYDKAKANIEKLDGKTNPDAAVTGGGGGGAGGGGTGGGGVTSGNDLLNQKLQDQLSAANSAAGGAVTVTLIGNAFAVKVNDTTSDLNAFTTVASAAFGDFKTNKIVVNTATATYTTKDGSFTFTSDDVNNAQDFGVVIDKALGLVGLPRTTKLSVLKGKSISFDITGSIDSNVFGGTYTFSFN